MWYPLCFNSLQTGKHIQRICINLFQNEKDCFNSLQTGKHIQRRLMTAASTAICLVSIPFKRESISKDGASNKDLYTYLFGFNSLQTGKHIQRKKSVGTAKNGKSFNSLQTGKHIQRGNRRIRKRHTTTVSIPFKRESISKETFSGSPLANRLVSIPFKRESGSKVLDILLLTMRCMKLFQFPSNGKADPKC